MFQIKAQIHGGQKDFKSFPIKGLSSLEEWFPLLYIGNGLKAALRVLNA